MAGVWSATTPLMISHMHLRILLLVCLAATAEFIWEYILLLSFIRIRSLKDSTHRKQSEFCRIVACGSCDGRNDAI